MKSKPILFISLFFMALSSHPVFSQKTPADAASGALTIDEVINLTVENERRFIRKLRTYHPLVETYIQNLEPHDELGAVPKNDRYFLGKLDLTNGVTQKSLLPEPGFVSQMMSKITQLYSVEYLPNGFAQMVIVDDDHFDRQNYKFTYVRREFLGDVRCYVFDLQPSSPGGAATFWGRIWVEDEGHNIVRINGMYGPKIGSDLYFHFDSWRENIGPDGSWLPAYIYTEESNMPYFLGQRRLRFKGQTRFWGYNIKKPSEEDEMTSLRIEADHVRDVADTTTSMSPVQSFRAWERHAETNVLNRMQKAGLIAPYGEVDKVLETVVNNLEITNNLNIEPQVRCRVLLTSPLESFTIGRTIVLSRGLIDVLPDEASLAMVLSHELAHIALGHRLDTKYAFNDRMLFGDEETFQRIFLKRNEKEEAAADRMAAEFLQNSPYKEKLSNAGLFLRAVDSRAGQLTQLLRSHMGNRMAQDSKVRRMTSLLSGAPALEAQNTEQIAALPLGGRVRVNGWNDELELIKSEPVSLVSAREKMPFEVTPVFLHLTRSRATEGTAQTSVR